VSERKKYTTVRVEQEAFDLLDKLIERLAMRSYGAMPEEMGGRGKPTKVNVIHAALKLLERQMDAEDVGAVVVAGGNDRPAEP